MLLPYEFERSVTDRLVECLHLQCEFHRSALVTWSVHDLIRQYAGFSEVRARIAADFAHSEHLTAPLKGTLIHAE